MKTKLEIAKEYTTLGFSVFACHAIENGKCTCGNNSCTSIAKHPLTQNGVKDATLDDDTLYSFFTGSYAIANIGIATGQPSGVFVLDVDDNDALNKLTTQYGQLPPTWIVQTGSGGMHYYFRYTEACTHLKNAVKFAGSLDVRTTGGYVLAPPSIHASGNEYRWLVPPDVVPLANAPDWLIDAIPKHDDEPKTQTKDEGVDAMTVQRATSDVDRCRLYLAACPPAISGQRGHDTTYSVVCRIVELFGLLSDDELLDALTDWNSRCEPPWTQKELKHKITSARQKVVTQPTEAVNDDWPTLDVDAYYGLAGETVKVIEPHTEADTAALLITLLTAFGCSVGRGPYFRVEGDKHHANLFSVIVGDSSRARKGTSLGRIVDLFDNADESFKHCRYSGLSTGEGLIHALRDADVEVKDTTFTVSDGVHDKRCWVTESELARTLKVIKRESNTLSASLRDAWDRGDLQTLTRSDPLRASDVHVAITAHITRDELRKSLDSTEVLNGFANRFLWALVKRSKLLPHGSDGVDLSELKQRLSDAITKARRIGKMQRSSSCVERWTALYPLLVAEKTHPTWDAVTSRAEAQVLRLSMLYALLDGSPIIETYHQDAALAVWRYCDDSARILFSDCKDKSLDGRILDAVKTSPGIMRTELRDKTAKNVTLDTFDSSLAYLQQRGSIVHVPVYENRQADRYYPGVSVPQSFAIAETETTAEPPAIPKDDIVDDGVMSEEEFYSCLDRSRKREPKDDDEDMQPLYDAFAKAEAKLDVNRQPI